MNTPRKVMTINDLLSERMQTVMAEIEAHVSGILDWNIDHGTREMPSNEVQMSSGAVEIESVSVDGVIISFFIQDIFCRVRIGYLLVHYPSMLLLRELAEGISLATKKELPWEALVFLYPEKYALPDEDASGDTMVPPSPMPIANQPLVSDVSLRPPDWEAIAGNPALLLHVLRAFDGFSGKLKTTSPSKVIAPALGLTVPQCKAAIRGMDRAGLLLREGAQTRPALSSLGQEKLQELERRACEETAS